jgi:hypothetical protein
MPILLPPSGGSFDFNIAVVNNEPLPITFDVWCDVTLPNGVLYGPVLGAFTFTFNSGQSLNRDRTQAVPAAAPPGNYTYNAYVGEHPSVVWSSDTFNFTKLSAGPVMPEITQWANYGEPMTLDWDEGAVPELPNVFRLEQNFPNPFNSSTAISFQIPTDSYVTLRVYDTAGRLVTLPVSGWRQAGSHEVIWEAKNLPSGIYFCRLQTGEHHAVKKMLLLK